jgi:hypothetical protein
MLVATQASSTPGGHTRAPDVSADRRDADVISTLSKIDTAGHLREWRSREGARVHQRERDDKSK